MAIDGFANQKRASCLATTQFTRISESLFTCYLEEAAVTEIRDKKIAKLTRRNMFGLLGAVTKVMQERAEWDILKVTSAALQKLKEEARDDIIRNAGSRRYHWTL